MEQSASLSCLITLLMVAIRHRSISMHFSVTEKLNCHLLEQRHLSPNWFGYWLAVYNLHPWHYHLRSPSFHPSFLSVNCPLRPPWAVCEKSVSGDPRNGHWTWLPMTIRRWLCIVSYLSQSHFLLPETIKRGHKWYHKWWPLAHRRRFVQASILSEIHSR